MSDFIPYGRQSISGDDIAAVNRVLKSDFLTQGPEVQKFEADVKLYCGAKHAVAVNSATSALHVACLALGVGTGDTVWTSPITFVASSNAALLCGASVDFVDIDYNTVNISVDELERKLIDAEKAGKLPKVLIPVHMCGLSCDMRRISLLAEKYDFRIIEDASHSVGASYRESKVGSCQYSDIAVFSFHPVKIVTTGEGGMALTNNDVLAETMSRLRSHGITRDHEQLIRENPESWYYEQLDLGLNYRMTDIAAALGASQMQRLERFIDARRAIAGRYHEQLAELPLDLPEEPEGVRSSYHLYVVNLQKPQAPRRRGVFDTLRGAGIGVNVHYIPVYHQPYYQQLGFEKGYCRQAERYYESCITLPLFPELTEEQQDFVVANLKQAIL